MKVEVLVGTDADAKKRLAAAKENDAVASILTLVFATNELLNTILSMKSVDLPQ